jgi:mono/diheme cytochrome c family protein
VALAVAAVSSCLLAACGGGDDAGVKTPQTPPVATATGRDAFLLFPNPQRAPEPPVSPPVDSLAYAQAYYAAIDPDNRKDTLAKWKAANGFGSNTGTEVTVVFGDTRDLRYGRRMTGRIGADGKTVAFVVENYQVDPGGAYGYSPLSLEAAVREDTRWRILVNAIEWSPGPNGGASFVKLFNFDAVTGERSLTVDLDGRGDKYMPGPCLTCHGGRGDALVPDDSGTLRFPLVRNAVSNTPGDTQARLAPLEVDHFDFSPLDGFTRAEQEQKLKTLNMMVLCSYPLAFGTPHGVPTTFCARRDAADGEWQGTAADLLLNAYGDDLSRPVYADTLIPQDWIDGQQRDLYTKVVAPSCRGCHMLRGVSGQSDVDLTTLAKFESYASDPEVEDRIKVHVFDRLDMPLAKTVFDTFWGSANPPILARFLAERGFDLSDANGAPPLRPIANPGPDRVVPQLPATLSAAQSLNASAFQWSIVSGPAGATLANAQSVQATFDATQPGTYVVRLVASFGATQSKPALLTLKVAAPGATPTFASVRKILFDDCRLCHSPQGSGNPPIIFADRGANGLVPRTDIARFHAEVRSRVNFADIVASPLLRKPANLHHGGGLGPGFDNTKAVGDEDRESYDLFVNWILAGAPND